MMSSSSPVRRTVASYSSRRCVWREKLSRALAGLAADICWPLGTEAGFARTFSGLFLFFLSFLSLSPDGCTLDQVDVLREGKVRSAANKA